MKAISSVKSYINGNNSVYLLANIRIIAFAIVLRVRKSPKFQKVSKTVVDACVYTWAFSLLRLGRLAMPLT